MLSLFCNNASWVSVCLYLQVKNYIYFQILILFLNALCFKLQTQKMRKITNNLILQYLLTDIYQVRCDFWNVFKAFVAFKAAPSRTWSYITSFFHALSLFPYFPPLFHPIDSFWTYSGGQKYLNVSLSAEINVDVFLLFIYIYLIKKKKLYWSNHFRYTYSGGHIFCRRPFAFHESIKCLKPLY